MANRMIIGNAWNEYQEGILPADASEVQINECRAAFYAGAFSAITGLMMVLDGSPDASDADMQAAQGMMEEFTAYAAEVGLQIPTEPEAPDAGG